MLLWFTITRPAIESQAAPVRGEGLVSRGSALCDFGPRWRRTLSQGWSGESGDPADVMRQSGLLASAQPAGEKDPRVRERRASFGELVCRTALVPRLEIAVQLAS